MAHKNHQTDVIETLHDLQLAHIEEFSPDEDEELAIGDPLPEASQASERLVRVRSLLTALDVEGEPDRGFRSPVLRDRLDRELEDVAAEVNEASEHRDELQRELEDVRGRMETLEPFRELPLRLEDYRGYETLEVFVGRGPEALGETLAAELDRFERFTGGGLTALFVHGDEADRAQELLVREGFRGADVPEGEGTPRDRLRELESRAGDLERELAEAERELDRLAGQHRDFLLCAEEELSIVVEKAEAPLGFAATERAFVCDAWVPTRRVDEVKTAVSRAADGRVHFETIDEGRREVHGREEEPPTRYDHAGLVTPFDYLMETFSTPSYDEIDPTVILSLVFPLFLGFMIGDLGYGVLMAGLGLLVYRRLGPKSEAAESLGFALGVSGVWAILFGGIVFRDALGIPLYATEHGLNWPSLLGLHAGAGQPMIHKIEATGVKAMLALSLLAAFVHLFLGFSFGLANHLGHDTKHAAAQVGWLVTLSGLFVLTLVKGPANAVSAFVADHLGLMTSFEVSHGHVEAIHFTSTAQTLPWYLLGPGVLVLVLTEGFMGVMETFSLLANMISYTRLAGVAVAKGGMVVAFNGIFLEDMALAGGPALLVVGFALFVLAQLIVFTLGLISSGIQSIRLNYVEFFLKFFEGGGERFSPFGRDRKFTTSSDTR